MTSRDLLLIDFSSLAVPIWMVSGSEPDPNWTCTKIVERVRALTSDMPSAAICCDSRGKNFRHELDATYKQQRETQPEAMYHQMELAKEMLRSEGFPIWSAQGFEADDVLASAVDAALKIDGVSVLIASSDKDILQLVGPRVHVKSLRDGAIVDADGVTAKFGVAPTAIRDYLALVGDASDNIKGARGIGAKTAAKLLAQFGTLDAIMAAGGEGLTPAVRDSLVEFSSRVDVVRSLIALRADVPVRIEDAFAPRGVVATERQPANQTYGISFDGLGEKPMAETQSDAPQPAPTSEARNAGNPAGERAPESRVDRAVESSVANQQHRAEAARAANETQSLAQRGPGVMPAPAPAEWTMQLEPRSIDDAWRLAQRMHESRLFSAYGTPSAVLSTILAGRELGLQAMASLRAFHIIEGRPTLSAGIIQAMVVKSPACEYFRCTERTNERATFETKRRDNPPLSLTFTLEEAKLAAGGTLKAGSGWTKNPADMCVARAATKLARLVYPDIVSGLYAPEEMQD